MTEYNCGINIPSPRRIYIPYHTYNVKKLLTLRSILFNRNLISEFGNNKVDWAEGEYSAIAHTALCTVQHTNIMNATFSRLLGLMDGNCSRQHTHTYSGTVHCASHITSPESSSMDANTHPREPLWLSTAVRRQFCDDWKYSGNVRLFVNEKNSAGLCASVAPPKANVALSHWVEWWRR